MSTDLAAQLVEEGVVAADAMARAVARQAEAGGALDTALLELGLLDEAAVTGALARASGLPPAPEAAWTALDPRARRVFPAKLAERHGFAPFALDGRDLHLVAAFPVDAALLDEVSFMLSLHLVPHVGPEWRVRALIARLYGTALPDRLAALAGGVPALAPEAEPEPVAEPGMDAAAAEDGAGLPEDEEPLDLSDEVPPEAPAAGFAPDAGEPAEPLAAALAQAVELADLTFDDEEPPPERQPAQPAPAAPEPSAESLDRTAPPRWSLEEARAALAAAGSRDEVVVTALRHARDVFEFAALFAVTRDAVAGHDALGLDEDARELARGVAIYASDPGIFHTVIDARSPYLGPVGAEAAGNEAILSGLGRGVPHTVLVYPVLVRDRPACVLYADNGEAPVSPQRVGDLLLFLAGLGGAFERILRDRKQRRGAAAAAPAAPEAPSIPPPEAFEPLELPVAPAAPWDPSPAGPEPVEERPAASEAASIPPPEAFEPLELPAAPAAAWNPSPVPPEPIEERPAEDAPPVPEPPADAEGWRAHEPARAAPPAPPEEIEVDLDEYELASAPAAAPRPRPEQRSAGVVGADSPARAPEPAPPPSPIERLRVAAPGSAARRAALEDVLAVLADPDREARRAAIEALAEAGDPIAFAPIAERAFDPEPAVAEAARAALARHRRAPKMRPVPEKLRRALLSGIALRATAAAKAIGALQDAESIPVLIQVLEASGPGPADAAADALAAITLQHLGPDARRWLGWWKENRGRGRAEWLFAGLMSEDRAVRLAAARELSELAPAPAGYDVDAPAEERERAARAWASGWARSGQAI